MPFKSKKTKKPDISDHAIVRYFERVLGFDMKEIEKDIFSEEFVRIYRACQGSHATIPFKEGFRAVVEKGIIVTILGKKDKRSGYRHNKDMKKRNKQIKR